MAMTLNHGVLARPRGRRVHRAATGRRGLLILLAAVLLASASPAAANAASGYRDFSWAQAMGEKGPIGLMGPTGEKPQSKLWYNDGLWWADMFDVGSNKWMIFRLDPATQTWVNTGTALDDRPQSWADTLWDGTHLYVASAGTNPTSPSDRARLYRYSYSAATKAYKLDGGGFPATIANYGVEAIVLD